MRKPRNHYRDARRSERRARMLAALEATATCGEALRMAGEKWQAMCGMAAEPSFRAAAWAILRRHRAEGRAGRRARHSLPLTVALGPMEPQVRTAIWADAKRAMQEMAMGAATVLPPVIPPEPEEKKENAESLSKINGIL